MALIKTDEEIEKLKEGGALLSKSLQAAIDAAKPGMSMKQIDEIAEGMIREGGGEPSFLGYKGGGPIPFPSSVCISRNHEVVHGIGTRDHILEEGDIVGLDMGLWLHGLCTDMAVTIPIGKISDDRLALLRTTRNAMRAGVQAAEVGKFVHTISAAVEDEIDQKKYGIVKALVGHGVGHEVHELPHIPNFRSKQFPKVALEKGMVLAIEPMVTAGSEEVKTLEDGWTITTIDESVAAHFEVTIALSEKGPIIITPEPEVAI